MARATWSLLIGMLSTFMYTCLALFNIVYLLYLRGYIEPQEPEDRPDDTNTRRGNLESLHSYIFIIACDAVVFVTMIVVSILLQVGVKRDRHQLLCPWLCLSGIVLALGGIGLFSSQSYWDVEFILDALVIVLQAAMWYPIYEHYQEMRQHERLHIESCNRQRNGAAYYMGPTSDLVYAPTTESIPVNNIAPAISLKS